MNNLAPQLSETDAAERAARKRARCDRAVDNFKGALHRLEIVMDETKLRPVALDRPEIKRRLIKILAKCDG